MLFQNISKTPHYEKGEIVPAGGTVESDLDYEVYFPNKFKRVPKESVKKVKAEEEPDLNALLDDDEPEKNLSTATGRTGKHKSAKPEKSKKKGKKAKKHDSKKRVKTQIEKREHGGLTDDDATGSAEGELPEDASV